MNATVLAQLGRHVLLPEIGTTGQNKIQRATVLGIGDYRWRL